MVFDSRRFSTTYPPKDKERKQKRNSLDSENGH